MRRLHVSFYHLTSALHLAGAGLLLLLTLLSGSTLAADLPGAKDHPLLKRFGGSEIIAYDNKRFVEYDLQTSTFENFDLTAKKREFVSPPLHLEGALTRLWYESQGDTSSVEMLRNYANELTAQGFEIIYDSTKDAAAVKWNNYLAPFGSMDMKNARSTYVFFAADKKGIKVLSAKKARDMGDV